LRTARPFGVREEADPVAVVVLGCGGEEEKRGKKQRPWRIEGS
jgi:hypothetical protein